MKIGIFGLGYTGCVTAACLAQLGHQVLGVDISYKKVKLIEKGISPIVENELDDIIKEQTNIGRLKTTQNTGQAVGFSEVILVCVGTPDNGFGDIDHKQIERVCGDIGDALKDKQDFVTIVVRSTILPGFARNIILPALELNSGKKAGRDFDFVLNPEFLREGSGVYDFYHPPKTVVAAGDAKSQNVMEQLYKAIDENIIFTGFEEASLIKYVDNAFHAVKVTFGNEIGRLCRELNVDTRAVFDLFLRDKKLNISPLYLQPGFAFGGSCLPKDLRAITCTAGEKNVELPLLKAVLKSNDEHILYAYRLIRKSGKKNIGFLGLSFKSDTDDLRESPYVRLANYLLADDFNIKIYDRNVELSKLVGSNREFMEKTLPQIGNLLCGSVEQVIAESDMIVIGNRVQDYEIALKKMSEGKKILDLSMLNKTSDFNKNEIDYEGICW